MTEMTHAERLQRGGEHLRADRLEEARAELEQAERQKPGDGRVGSLLGLTYFRLGQYREAGRIYGELVERSPSDASLRLNLGLVHLKLGSAREAISELKKARELDPSQMRTLGYLGLAYARQGEYGLARDAFLKAGQEDLAREMEQHLRPSDEAAKSMMSDGVLGAAVRLAQPTTPAASARTAEGHRAPEPLCAFAAARLVRPDDGDLPFEIAPGGALVVRVHGRVWSRTEDVVVSGGELTYEAATRQVHGRSTDLPFGTESLPMFVVSGRGHLVFVPRGGTFTAVELADDALYLREDRVFAFEERLRWENGHVPGSEPAIHVVQLRGEGCVAMRFKAPPLLVKLAPERVLYVDALVLVGWMGRVVPRVVSAMGTDTAAPFVECTGEGMVLIENPEA